MRQILYNKIRQIVYNEMKQILYSKISLRLITRKLRRPATCFRKWPVEALYALIRTYTLTFTRIWRCPWDYANMLSFIDST